MTDCRFCSYKDGDSLSVESVREDSPDIPLLTDDGPP
jgi:hypothetical protein